MKVTVIGGGSSYTPELADGIIKNYGTFPVSEVALVDIEAGREKAEIICALLGRMFSAAGLSVQTSFTLDRKAALAGADFVISQFRVGGLAARSRDEKIPLKYGIIGQETTGPGGFAKALRTIPQTLALCRDMEAICPDAWLINFTNPSGMITEAVSRYTKVKCIGLCNVPINMEREIVKTLGPSKNRVYCAFAGLNHLSFIGRLYVDGQNVLAGSKGLPGLGGSIVKNIAGPQIPVEAIEALGFIPSPYLKYYYLERAMFEEEIEKFKGTGKTRADDVMETESLLFQKYRDPDLAEKPEELSKRGGAYYSEAAVSLMNSIWNDLKEVHVVNTLNRGAITGLPPDAVVETNCLIGKEGPTPLAYGPLPLAISGLVHQAKAYERLTIEAAVEKDSAKAVIALMNNPLVRDFGAAKSIFEEIVAANAQFLSDFMKAGK